jgi:hypothetical protein
MRICEAICKVDSEEVEGACTTIPPTPSLTAKTCPFDMTTGISKAMVLRKASTGAFLARQVLQLVVAIATNLEEMEATFLFLPL